MEIVIRPIVRADEPPAVLEAPQDPVPSQGLFLLPYAISTVEIDRFSDFELARQNQAGRNVLDSRNFCSSDSLLHTQFGPGGSVRGERANFTRIVLGCIEARFWK